MSDFLDDYRGRLLARAFHDELEKMAMKPPANPGQMPDAKIPALPKSGGGTASVPKNPVVAAPTPRKQPTLGGAAASKTTVNPAAVKPVKSVASY
ncbi:MAG: hypothetical protein VXZ72_03130 [Chlamydiota bacterium]|nr:hypothetical protein [Chlamydiota bacterium]